MSKFLYPAVIVMIVVLIGFGGWLFFSSFISGGAASTERGSVPFEHNSYNSYSNPSNLTHAEETAKAPKAYQYPNEITPTTRMVYEFLSEDNQYQTIIEAPSSVLIGMSQEELAAMFVDWQLLNFSANEVHMRQKPLANSRPYVIGVYGGYIAVFYDGPLYSIKELTSRPIAALDNIEQERLKEGIRVEGNDALMRALEDFSS